MVKKNIEKPLVSEYILCYKEVYRKKRGKKTTIFEMIASKNELNYTK
jgi:hypothetical protein